MSLTGKARWNGCNADTLVLALHMCKLPALGPWWSAQGASRPYKPKALILWRLQGRLDLATLLPASQRPTHTLSKVFIALHTYR